MLQQLPPNGQASAQGYAMVALLVAMSIMAVMLGLALPVWQTAIRREREAELVFRGEQYVQAIRLFQRRYAGTFPPDVDVLVKQRFLRRRYQDPITGRDFQPVYAGTKTTTGDARGVGALPPTSFSGRGGIIGVVSRSTEASLRLYNGRGRYNEWSFVATAAATSVTTRSGVIAGEERAPQAGAVRPGVDLSPPQRLPARVLPSPPR
jgi:type II secretory pathway pseudopilin PulG